MKKIYLLLFLSCGISGAGFSQTPPWYFINTGVENTHVILVQETIPMLLDGQPLQVGDYIGAFYQILDTLICGTGTGNTGDVGGLMVINSVSAATIWGAEPNVSNGFQVGEAFQWKIWRASDGSVFNATVEYDLNTPNITDSGYYVTNGISKMASLTAYSIPGIDLSVNQQLSPISGCGSLQDQAVVVLLENHDTLDVIGFSVNFTLNNGDTITEFVNDTIFAGATYEYTFNQLVSLLNLGDYFFHVWINFPGDVNYTNDFNKQKVTISNFPVVDLGDDVSICEGETALLQTDTFFAGYSWNTGSNMQFLYASAEGYYYCTITDHLGCQGFDSVHVTVLALPQFDLPDTVRFCEGLHKTVTIEGTFESYHWSNGITTPSLYISIPNMYSVTVTDSVGCSSVDSLIAIATTLPQIDLPDVVKICEGLSTNVTIEGSFESYVWSNGDTSPELNITIPDLYSVTVTDIAGCTSVGTLVAELIVIPPIDLGDTIYSDKLDTISLDAGVAFYSYLWNTGGINRVLTPTEYGEYSVTVSDGDCEGVGSVWVKQDTVKYFRQLIVWPNPSNGLLTFYLPKTETISIEVYNVLGQQLISDEIEADNIIEYDVRHLRSGPYILVVKTDDRKFTKRLIITK
ncbi:MAG: T9SS type A sorting domain-containing protein [Bacteroidales bacterium]|nr:T9SS type A sorting domain-containing protein [Bacteroidales bacterium]MCF8457733.1 T9SS type A sorting domain-containing protein [Bacteroidales bacterium]